MSETTFVIKELDNGWYWDDIYATSDAEIYCVEELEVPDEFIEKVEVFNEAFRIQLQRSRSYFRDDWYVNLQRIGA